MKPVVISPEHDDPREVAILAQLFAAGLDRYHVRKPHASLPQLESWLRALPTAWHSRLALHQHHALVATLNLGGVHWRDPGTPPPSRPASPDPALGRSGFASRSCHDLATLRAALGRYDAVFFSPVFPSLSKPGHAPGPDASFDELAALLARRTADERRTAVLALGGITAETAPRALGLGFDGVAVLGAIWQAADPRRAFLELTSVLEESNAARGRARPSPAAASTDSTPSTRGPRVSPPSVRRSHAA